MRSMRYESGDVQRAPDRLEYPLLGDGGLVLGDPKSPLLSPSVANSQIAFLLHQPSDREIRPLCLWIRLRINADIHCFAYISKVSGLAIMGWLLIRDVRRSIIVRIWHHLRPAHPLTSGQRGPPTRRPGLNGAKVNVNNTSTGSTISSPVFGYVIVNLSVPSSKQPIATQNIRLPDLFVKPTQVA